MKIRLNLKGVTAFAIVSILMGFAIVSFAQTGSPTPAPGVVTALTNVNSKVPSAIPAAFLTFLTLIITELAAHGVPTNKALSWFFVPGTCFGLLASIFTKLQTLCTTLGNTLQNLSPPSNPPSS